MKKIIILMMVLTFGFAFAQDDLDLSTLIYAESTPTDAEIMEVINKYNFPQSQKDYLFREVKKRLADVERQKAQTPKATEQTTVRKYSNHDPLTRRSK